MTANIDPWAETEANPFVEDVFSGDFQPGTTLLQKINTNIDDIIEVGNDAPVALEALPILRAMKRVAEELDK